MITIKLDNETWRVGLDSVSNDTNPKLPVPHIVELMARDIREMIYMKPAWASYPTDIIIVLG